MISAFSRHPHHRTFGSHTQKLNSRESHCWQSPFRSSPLRRISKLLVKALSNSRSQKSTPQYILTVKEKSAVPSKLNQNIPHNYSAGTKNGSVIQSTIIDVVPATSSPTSRVIPLPSDSPAMNSKIASTSRGGSNQSTSQSFIDAYLARRKREEIQRLMEMLVEWIDSRASTTHASGAGSSSRPTASTRSSSSTSSTPQKVAGQKRSLRRDSFDGSDPGRDGNEEDKRGNKRSRTGTSPALKLACPFFKREPGKYADRQACTGPGYTSISRLKEHIYRAHKQPDNKCNRCCYIFATGEQLEEHQRAEDPCKVSKDKVVDGINEAQYHQLRKKPVGHKTNAERWEEVYRIIFPKASVIPSCYYEYDDKKRVPECCDEDLGLTEFIENALIEGVRNDLEDQFESFTENTRRNFIDIVKKRFSRIQQQLFDQRKILQSMTAPNTTQPGTQLVTDNTFPDIDIDFDELLASSELECYDASLADPFVGEVSYSSTVSDSAYFSMDSPKSPLTT